MNKYVALLVGTLVALLIVFTHLSAGVFSKNYCRMIVGNSAEIMCYKGDEFLSYDRGLAKTGHKCSCVVKKDSYGRVTYIPIRNKGQK
jgi:hypothetical protein